MNTNPDLESVFDNTKTIYNDASSFLYINRLQKFRNEEIEKKKKLSPDLSKIFTHKLGKYAKHLWEGRHPYHLKYLNEKTKNVIQQNLHKELHNFSIADD